MIESANLMSAVDGGAVRWHQVRELGEIVHGTAPGRQGVSDSTLFISNGFAIEDVAVAMKAYQLASAQGLGSTVSLRESLGKSG
jgi:alanine dehydrogenase